MSHDPVEDLRKEIAKGRVLAIVGAGISIGATHNAPAASWTGLLETGVKHCVAVVHTLPEGWSKRVMAEIRSGDMDDLLSAAEKIARKLGSPDGGNYRAWLRETVGSLTATDRTALEALHDLGIPLATTNYDGLLEEVTRLSAVTWREGARVERVIRGDTKGILHLHGYWEQPESVILGIRSYQDILGNAHAQNVLKALRTVNTLLFVGCGEGLDDPNFGALLEWSREVFSGSEYPHYRLCRESEAPALRNRHPQEERIIVLAYGPSHSDLALFLRSLRPEAAPKLPEKKAEKKQEEPSTEKRAPRLPPASHCFGRVDQVKGLVATLCADSPSPAPVLGPPGVGKTTITLTALRDPRVAEKYGTRRYFVRCDGAKSRDALIGEIATALQLEPGPNLEDRLFQELARAPAVLVLDNAETPWEADTGAVEAFLKQLADIPGLALVASIRGEQRPTGLNWKEAIRVGPLDLESARETFLAVAGERYHNDPDLERLLMAVDKLPLAVTLLAHQAEGEPDLSRVWKQWQKKKTALLRWGYGEDRLKNLEVSLELSIQGSRMTKSAQRLLSLLGVLPDGIARENLDAFLPAEGETEASTLCRVGLAIATDSRLRVLAPIREHVGVQHPPRAEDLERVITYYLNLAQLGEHAGEEGGSEAIQKLTPEAGNLEAVILRVLEEPDPLPAMRAAFALTEFYRFTGLGTVNLLERARALARDFQDKTMEVQCVKRLADIALHRSDHTTALKQYQEALQLYDHLGDLHGQANCIRKLGNIAFDHSDHDAAREQFQKALQIYKTLGDLGGQASCILGLGDLALRLFDHNVARERYEEALPLFQRVGDSLGQASYVLRLGYIAHDLSDHDVACERYQEALLLFQKVGDPLGQANCIRNLGKIAFDRSGYEVAHERCQEALTLYRRVGSLHGQANCIQSLGDIEFHRNDYEAARTHYQEALTLYARIADPYPIGEARVRLARIALAEQRQYVKAAREAWVQIKRPDLMEMLDKEFGAGSP